MGFDVILTLKLITEAHYKSIWLLVSSKLVYSLKFGIATPANRRTGNSRMSQLGLTAPPISIALHSTKPPSRQWSMVATELSEIKLYITQQVAR